MKVYTILTLNSIKIAEIYYKIIELLMLKLSLSKWSNANLTESKYWIMVIKSMNHWRYQKSLNIVSNESICRNRKQKKSEWLCFWTEKKSSRGTGRKSRRVIQDKGVHGWGLGLAIAASSATHPLRTVDMTWKTTVIDPLDCYQTSFFLHVPLFCSEPHVLSIKRPKQNQ